MKSDITFSIDLTNIKRLDHAYNTACIVEGYYTEIWKQLSNEDKEFLDHMDDENEYTYDYLVADERILIALHDTGDIHYIKDLDSWFYGVMCRMKYARLEREKREKENKK